MNEFMSLMELILFDNAIPIYIKQDVSKRISDWCEHGGCETDDYVKRQYYYLLEVKDKLN